MRLTEIISEFDSVKNQIESRFGTLSPTELNWKPSESGWSIGQCIEHMILSKKFFLPVLDEVASGRKTNTFWENWSPLRALGTRLYFFYIKSDRTKVKAPTARIVPPSDIKADVVERFRVQQEDIVARIRKISEDDAARATLTSPFLGLVTYKFNDGLMILAEHDRRHIRQALRVLEMEDFPKA
jgi:hypothetical protein